ncbi:amino acid ABC transporter permease [Tatumella citrea]|uniref:Amino acid ABC transporter permease n=1 Tax=Tatumella citrea TaxID=53336 RepID=A0A1Y0LJ69_TATCI|nr:amino acid ABC transporter permease [Tatumella citrea]ARU93797.1 amino acid ABC transporter permease [Tatumella citrea]ARU97835.1 amino acid ABC transporter permease [Tatumella citrea]
MVDFSTAFSFIFAYKNALLSGLLNTLYYTAISLVLGLALGFIVSMLRQSGNILLKTISGTYVEVFRGTPILVQLFWFFFCLPAILGINLGNQVSTILTMTLYMGAISSESFRSALKSVGEEQKDACVSLGMSLPVMLLFVFLPQMLIRSVPTLLSNSVTLFKESALISAVGMGDLMYQGQMIADSTARPVEILTTVALIYFIIAFTLTRAVTYYEKILLNKIKL